jgi:peptidoglycan hydrolase-like protein with peptidoglycan-binding domain
MHLPKPSARHRTDRTPADHAQSLSERPRTGEQVPGRVPGKAVGGPDSSVVGADENAAGRRPGTAQPRYGGLPTGSQSLLIYPRASEQVAGRRPGAAQPRYGGISTGSQDGRIIPGNGSPVGNAPTATSPTTPSPSASPIPAVLPRLCRARLTRPTITGFTSTLAAVVAIVVAAVAPSLPEVQARPTTAVLLRVAVPGVPSGLPTGIEDLATYVGQASCDPAAKPGVLKLSKLLISTYPGTSAWSPRGCGLDGPGARSEHYEGRALDWSVSVRDAAGARQASALLGWLLAADATGHRYANVRRLGIMYIIWNNRMWRAYDPASGWRPYRDCAVRPDPGHDTICHRNHIHFSLSWAGAMGRTSFWSRAVARPDYGPCRPADLNWAAPYAGPHPAPCRSYPAVRPAAGVSGLGATLVVYSGATVGPGSTGPVVSILQQALGKKVDSRFGTATAGAVSSFRTTHGLSPGKQVDAATWRALLATFAVPAPGGGTGVPATRTPSPAAPVSPLARYSRTVLRYGARGPAVIAVQRALKVSPVSGWFGPVTRRAVIRFQATHGVPRTGNVGPLTWKALGG